MGWLLGGFLVSGVCVLRALLVEGCCSLCCVFFLCGGRKGGGVG